MSVNEKASSNELESFIAAVEGLEGVVGGVDGGVERLDSNTDPELELTTELAKAPANALRLVKAKGFPGMVVSGLVSTRKRVALSLGVETSEIPWAMENAQRNPGELVQVDAKHAGFSENRVDNPDIQEVLPVGRFYPGDGGAYCTAFVVAGRSPRDGLNLSFHRMMHLEKNRFAVRVVKRHLHRILQETGNNTKIAGFCGVHPAVLLAAAISGAPDMNELAVAAALMGGTLEVCEVSPGLFVPAHSHVVFTGRFTGDLADEGPFVDLTGTYDTVRKQPLLEVETLWMRQRPLYHSILPGGPEHKILMGLPREPSILQAARSLNPGVREVRLTEGGCSWLHAVISVNAPAPGQGVNIGLAALGAHASLKKVTIVDDDIDIHSSADVEWAESTRVQPHRDITIIKSASGSTLDPSRNLRDETTSKWIIDATKPRGRDTEFVRAELFVPKGSQKPGSTN